MMRDTKYSATYNREQETVTVTKSVYYREDRDWCAEVVDSFDATSLHDALTIVSEKLGLDPRGQVDIHSDEEGTGMAFTVDLVP
jgi:hypothetical protein